MEVKVKGEYIDLFAMREKMDVIVFDYIDTSHHWLKALKGLSTLLNQATKYYKSYVQKNNGQFPAANSYWLLFADVTSKLAFFTAWASYEVQIKQDEALNSVELERLLQLAGYGLPAIEDEENEVILEHVFDLYQKLPIPNIEEKVKAFEQDVRSKKGNLKNALAYFQEVLITK